MRVVTWNVNSLRVRLEHLKDFINYAKPDVVCLQETKVTNEQFPLEEIEAMGFQAAFSGQKTFNGVAILANQPIDEVVVEFPGFDDPQKRLIAATVGGVRLVNVYVPNGSSVGSEKYAYKLEWLKHLRAFLENELKSHESVLVMGDFNIAPEDIDVHDPEKWEGDVLVSEPERDALQGLLDLGFVDLYRDLNPESAEFSWWDYRAAGFRRNNGLRIDHFLANKQCLKLAKNCHIDKEPRTWERPSDHTPVITEINFL